MRQKGPEDIAGTDGEVSGSRDVLQEYEKKLVAQHLASRLLGETSGRLLNYAPSDSLGNRDSAHDVFFIRTKEKPSKGGQSFACKRFRRADNAERELFALQEVDRRGLPALTPAGKGVYSVEDIGYILVTASVPRLTTMNYLGWRDYYAGQPEYERRIAGPLRDIGTFVGNMHSRGVVHGDLQVKNVARDFKGDFMLFDLERAEFLDGDCEELWRVGKCADDLDMLSRSLVSRGFLWDATDKNFSEELTRNLFEPYLAVNGNVDAELVGHIVRVMDDANQLRGQLHQDFSSRIGVPS